MNLKSFILLFALLSLLNSAQSQKNTLPQSYDWRDLLSLSPVGDQGSCNAFYAFTTAVLAEVLHAIKHNQKSTVTLSKQQLVDCTNQVNDPSYYNQGCNGGDVAPAFEYLSKHGAVEEAYYPYLGSVSVHCTIFKYK